MTNLRQAAQQAILLCEWIDKAPHERGSINGMAAQVKHTLEQALAEPDSDYERGFVDGMNLQTKGSVDKAVNRMAQTTHWEGCEAVHPECRKPEQEPVAWYFVRDLDKGISFAPDRDPEKPWQPLYTAPTQAIEPVAWMVYTESGTSAYVTDSPNDLIGAYRALPLYTAPTPRKPLTDYINAAGINGADSPHMVVEKLQSVIERAHGIGGGE